MTKICENPTCNNIAKSKQTNRKVKFCSRKCGLDFHNYLHKLGKRAYAEGWEKCVEWQDIEKNLPPENQIVLCANIEDIENSFLGYWTERRQCMLSTVAAGAGECGEGFNDLLNHLPCSDVTHWLPIPEFNNLLTK